MQDEEEEAELDKTMEKLYNGSNNGRVRKTSESDNSEDGGQDFGEAEEEQEFEYHDGDDAEDV